jgi:plastocyanin
MRRRLIALTMAAALVGGIAAEPAQAAVVVKGVQTTNGFRWKPRAVSIAKGTKVVWRAVDGTHTVTAWKGAWSKNTTIAQGSSTSFTFMKRGVFKFRCRFHSSVANGVCSGMCGKVTVG